MATETTVDWKGKYEELRRELQTTHQRLGVVLSRQEGLEEETAKLRVLVAVHEKGLVTRAELDAIGETNGYSPQGLNGLFAWKSQGALLTRVSTLEGERIGLTEAGLELVQDFLGEE